MASLAQQLEARRIALEVRSVGPPPGMPLSLLEARLLPLYLHHRYQLQAVLKSVGGAYFTYAVRDTAESRPADLPRLVAPSEQRRALYAALATLDPQVLVLPPRILNLIPPPAFGYRGGIPELFPRETGPVFDPVAAATTAADLAVSGLLQPARAARLELFHARDAANPGFDEVVRDLLRRTWTADSAGGPGPRRTEDGTRGERGGADAGRHAPDGPGREQRGRPSGAGDRGERPSPPGRAAGPSIDAHGRETRDDIERFLNRPDAPRTRTPPPPVPAGEPI